MHFDDELEQSDDIFDWFTTTREYRRDRALSRRLDAIQQSRSDAGRDTLRLQRDLQASRTETRDRLDELERRLSAQVELDDLRDQVDPATRAVRAGAASMIEKLASGLPTQPMAPTDDGYELPDAMNAVRALATGRDDEGALDRAIGLDPSAEFLVVAAVAGLGRGEVVVDRLPDVLANDGVLSPERAVLFRAALAGAYGPDALARLAPAMSVAMSRVDWAGWLAEVEHPEERLAQAVGMPPLPEEPKNKRLVSWRPATAEEKEAVAHDRVVDLADLRRLAGDLIMQGRRDERARMARLAELSRIAMDGPESERAPLELAPEVQRLLLEPATPDDTRRGLLGWVARPLASAVAGLVLAAKEPPARRANVGGRDVVVRPDSASPDVAGLWAPSLAAARRSKARVTVVAAAGAVLVGLGLVLCLAARAFALGMLVILAGIGVGGWAVVRRGSRALEVGRIEHAIGRDRADFTRAKELAARDVEDAQALVQQREQRLGEARTRLAQAG